MPKAILTTEWICTTCGRRYRLSKKMGRPQPGVCPRALFTGRPHRWVKNRDV